VPVGEWYFIGYLPVFHGFPHHFWLFYCWIYHFYWLSPPMGFGWLNSLPDGWGIPSPCSRALPFASLMLECWFFLFPWHFPSGLLPFVGCSQSLLLVPRNIFLYSPFLWKWRTVSNLFHIYFLIRIRLITVLVSIYILIFQCRLAPSGWYLPS
jgi:hypothetical protein